MSKSYDLALLAIVKNEEMVIDEWIEHHIWQGVQHFYIIDNNSTDGTVKLLDKWISKGIVTLYFYPNKFEQVISYNKVFQEKAKRECKWLIVCDCDEFIYNKHRSKSILDALNKFTQITDIAGVFLFWKMFSSSGLENQPLGKIRESFIHRYAIVHTEFDKFHFKQIVNCDNVNTLIIHHHNYSKGSLATLPELACNHYCTMSREYWRDVKMTRGAADNPLHENIRQMDEFDKKLKEATFIDHELRNLVNTARIL